MIYVVLFLIGLAFGSFVNALVWRLRQQEKSQKYNKELSVVRGRSMCPNCKHTLTWRDLVPLVSWILLRARCRYCQKRISPQYPLVELATGLLFLASYIFWPYILTGLEWVSFAVWLGMLVGFVALAVYDFRWMELPNRIVYVLLGLAFFHLLFLAFTNGSANINQAITGTTVLGGLFLVLFYISGGKWIGGGDVKLGFVLGTWIGGFLPSILLLFLASVIGCLGAGILLVLKKNYKKVPFGPFLIGAAIIVQMFGGQIIDTYFSLNGL